MNPHKKSSLLLTSNYYDKKTNDKNDKWTTL